MARILVGVSGGIAAYKAVELVRLATAAGHSVRVIQTPASLEFVGRATFEGVTGAPVLVEEFEPDPGPRRLPGRPGVRPQPDLPSRAGGARRRVRDRAGVGQHAGEAGRRAGRQPAHERGAGEHGAARARAGDEQPDVRAPGHAGEPASCCAPGARAWWTPGTGRLASKGEWGVGRLAEPAEILAAAEAAIAQHAAPGRGYAPRSLDGLRVLVTAGGTREPIDSVRFIGNRSSGRMGVALAEEAARRGADVTLVAANVTIPPPAGHRDGDGRDHRGARGGGAREVRVAPTC